MTAPQGLRVMSIGNLESPEALGKQIFERSTSGAFPIQVEPDLPPAKSVVDCTIMSAGCTLPQGIDNPAKSASAAVANGAHALSTALAEMETGVFARASTFYRDMWSKGSLIDNPGPQQAAAIAACHDAFEVAAAAAVQAPGEGANDLATALTWALLSREGGRFVAMAEQLQASDALTPEVKADLESAIGLMRQ